MSGPVSLLGKPIPTIERNEGAKLAALLSIAGLIAGPITVGLVYPVGRWSIRHPHSAQYIFGAPLGITLAVSLAARGLVCGFGGFCKAISLVMLSTLAYFVAFWVAGRLELVFLSSERPPFNYPLSMFRRGLSCARRCISAGLSEGDIRNLGYKVLFCSVLCGILGIVGWDLGPYFGIYFWPVLRDLGLTPTDETFQNALYGDESHYFSLYVIWQTGTAAALGFVLQSRKSLSPAAPSHANG
jgi:hypothetical protein